MVATIHPVREEHLVWRDIDGEVVIAEKDSRTVRLLNRTASLIWALSDGTRQTEDIVAEVCRKFEVAPDKARVDVMEFCRQLLDAGLISIKDVSPEA